MNDPFSPAKKTLNWTRPRQAHDNTIFDELGRLSFVQYNEKIGNPIHARTRKVMPLTSYQLDFWNKISTSQNHKFHINKGRQMGFSELILRILSYRGFNKYAGKSCKIMAGTRAKATEKLITRLKQLYHTIPETIENNGDKLYLELKNGTTFEGLPANPEAITGDTKIAAIAMDEAAKWDLVDDTPVLNSVMPIVNTNGSDLFMFSTPKGPRGFFYRIETEKGTTYDYFTYNIWQTLDNLYTRDEIEKMLADPTMDTEQEYLNKYTTGRNSIFGSDFVTEDYEPAW